MIVKQVLCLIVIAILASCTLYENQARECINDKAVAYAKGRLTESEKCGLAAVSTTACPQDLSALGQTEAHRDEQTGSLACATDLPEMQARISCVWEFPKSLIRIEPPAANVQISMVDDHSLILESSDADGVQFRFQSEVEEGRYNYCVVETLANSALTDESLDILFADVLSWIQHRP